MADEEEEGEKRKKKRARVFRSLPAELGQSFQKS